MQRIAKGYTDEEFKLMAAVFSKQPIPKTKQITDAGMVTQGEKVYAEHCDKCHDENGALPDDDSGILASQWLPYLNHSMADFMDGRREMPKKMKKVVEKLSDDEIAAVLHFFASQQ
jgi:sulfide dehydrogenase cytochrome subunit